MVSSKQSSNSLYDFAKGKTPTNNVTLAEKCCCLLLIMLHNKACIYRRGGERNEGAELRDYTGLNILSPWSQ